MKKSIFLLFMLHLFAATLCAQQAKYIQTIRGKVIDERTGEPIAAVQIEFMDGATRIRGSSITLQDGSFELENVPTGPFRLRANRIGYIKTITPYWRIARGENLTVTVRMDPQAVLLAPLEILARSRAMSPVLSGFYERMQRNLGGVFLDRAEIEARQAIYVTDILGTVSGVEVRRSGLGDNRVRMRGCPASVFVDGVLASRKQDVNVDELASPIELEGIEIYKGAGTIPPQFRTADTNCGVIALWTRRGG